MNIKINFLSILIILGYACNYNTNEDILKSMNEPRRPLSELQYLVAEKGDSNAYYELDLAYLDHEHGDFFKFAKVMADKFDYKQAYYDVYFQTLKPTQKKGQHLV